MDAIIILYKSINGNSFIARVLKAPAATPDAKYSKKLKHPGLGDFFFYGIYNNAY